MQQLVEMFKDIYGYYPGIDENNIDLSIKKIKSHIFKPEHKLTLVVHNPGKSDLKDHI